MDLRRAIDAWKRANEELRAAIMAVQTPPLSAPDDKGEGLLPAGRC